MRMTLLVVITMALGAWAVPSSVWAETSTGTGTDSDTGTGAATGSSGGDDSCGSCSEPAESVVITSPADGADVPADLILMFEVGYTCECDTCGCYQATAESYSIFVDREFTASCSSGCTGMQSVDLQLSPGAHEILVSAEYWFHAESARITVNVMGEAGSTGGSSGSSGSTGSAGPTGDTSGSAGNTGDSGGGGGSGGSGGGGGCRVGAPSNGLGIAAWLLVLGLGRRRGRGRGR